MCVASAGQGHTDSGLCVGQSPQTSWQIRLLLAGSPRVKNVHHSLFVTEASLQSRAVPAHAKWTVLTEWWNFLSETSGERNQQLQYSNPCLILFIPLAFHSLSLILWSLTLKTLVHTRNCMHSSYPLSQVTSFQQDRLLLYFSFLAYRKLFPFVNFFFVIVPPPAGIQWNVGSCLPLALSLIKLNAIWSIWLFDIAPS